MNKAGLARGIHVATGKDRHGDMTKIATLPSPEEIARELEKHGMKVVGPPLKVD